MLNIKKVVKKNLIEKMLRAYRRDKFEIIKPITKYLTSEWFPKRKFIDAKVYAKENKSNFKLLLEQELELRYSDVIFHPQINFEKELIEMKGSQYSAEMASVKILGGSSLIIVDEKYALYDIRFQDHTKNCKYTDDGIIYREADDIVFLFPELEGHIESGIFFAGNYSSNYYHLLYEFMVKFKMLEELNIDKDVPLLIDEACFEIPQYSELLSYLNSDRTIKLLKKNAVYSLGCLIHISCPNFIPPNYVEIDKIEPSSILFNPDSISFLKKRLLPFKSNTGQFGKKVFLSRKNASRRRGYNEEEVLKLLYAYDFDVYHPEKLSIAEQIELFSEAELIVGATGAAFSNILFCQPKCNVVCLTNFAINLSVFSTIAKLNDVNLVYLNDSSLFLNHQSDLHEPFEVNLESLGKILKQYS